MKNIFPNQATAATYAKLSSNLLQHYFELPNPQAKTAFCEVYSNTTENNIKQLLGIISDVEVNVLVEQILL